MRAVGSGDGSGQQVVSDRILTIPNLLSMLRLFTIPLFALLILRDQRVAAVLVLAASGATDWLDGFLARRLHQVSRVGQLLDPVADRLYIVVTLLVLGYQDVVPVWLVALILMRDGMLSLTVGVLAHHGFSPLRVHFIGKSATFNLLYAFPLLLLGQGESTAALVARVFAWAFVWWGTGLYWCAGALYLYQAAGLIRHRNQDRVASVNDQAALG